MEGDETNLQKSRPRLPFKLWLILGLVGVLLSVALYMLFGKDSIISGVLGTRGEVDNGVMVADATGPTYANPMGTGGQPSQKPQSPPLKLLREIRHPAELQPRNSDYPELAAQPRLPVSCVANAKRCICFDQAAQLIDKMSNERCRSIINGQDSMVSAWARDDTPRRELYAAPPRQLLENESSASSRIHSPADEFKT